MPEVSGLSSGLVGIHAQEPGHRAHSLNLFPWLLCATPYAREGGDPGDLAWLLPYAAHLPSEKERAKGQKGHADQRPKGIREGSFGARRRHG